MPQNEEERLERTLKYKGLKTKLYGGDNGDSTDSFDPLECLQVEDIDNPPPQTQQKLSMNRYTSFLDNVIVKMAAKERQQLQIPPETPQANGGYSGRMTLR